MKHIHQTTVRNGAGAVGGVAGNNDHTAGSAVTGFSIYRHFEFAFQNIGDLLVRVLVLRQDAPCRYSEMGNSELIRVDESGKVARSEFAFCKLIDSRKHASVLGQDRKNHTMSV